MILNQWNMLSNSDDQENLLQEAKLESSVSSKIARTTSLSLRIFNCPGGTFKDKSLPLSLQRFLQVVPITMGTQAAFVPDPQLFYRITSGSHSCILPRCVFALK